MAVREVYGFWRFRLFFDSPERLVYIVIFSILPYAHISNAYDLCAQTNIFDEHSVPVVCPVWVM